VNYALTFSKIPNVFWLFFEVENALCLALEREAQKGDFCLFIPLYILKDEKILLYLHFF
jgi:hypothetical protein